MRIAVVGNRTGFTYEFVKDKLDKYRKWDPKQDRIVSGGAEGVDTFAQRYAKEKGLIILVIYPDLSIPSPERYRKRNELIVDGCNELIAFNKKEKSGTTMTINIARSKGLNVQVYS